MREGCGDNLFILGISKSLASKIDLVKKSSKLFKSLIIGSSVNNVSSLLENLLRTKESVHNDEISLWGLGGLGMREKNCLRLRFEGKEHDNVSRRWLVSKGIEALR